MKILCDVCNKDEASVFCTADEAALCGGCDHRVHHANKLASKHQRFSLLCPSPKEFPLCDVCQERRAFLFCQQDRAILCRECDLPIHTANEHTQKHSRFLLTGVKLSTTSEVYTSAASSASLSNGCDFVPDFKSEASSSFKKPVSVSAAISGPRKAAASAASAASAAAASAAAANNKDGNNNGMLASQESGSNGSTSSISEYLIEMLPGWHFEDFLDSCSASFGFCKKDDGLLPFTDNDNVSSFSSESLGIWVPQAPTPVPCNQSPYLNGGIIGGFKQTKEPATTRPGKRWNDDVFAVPEISPSSAGFKRSRPL